MGNDLCELHWAAGFWDGEGSAYVLTNQDRLSYVQLDLRQTEREPLDRWVAIIGEGRVRGPYSHNVDHDRWRPFWKWATGGRTALRVIAQIEDYVSAPKRRQFDDVRERVLAAKGQLSLVA